MTTVSACCRTPFERGGHFEHQSPPQAAANGVTMIRRAPHATTALPDNAPPRTCVRTQTRTPEAVRHDHRIGVLLHAI